MSKLAMWKEWDYRGSGGSLEINGCIVTDMTENSSSVTKVM
jgi:hypothetical protein